MDRVQEGLELGFDAGASRPVTGRLVAGQDLLERVPVEVELAAGRAFAEAVDEDATADLSPVVHVVVHRSTS